MKKTVIRFFALLLMLVTALGVLPQSADAAYENTHVNTGNYRQDIIAVALTQVGYLAGSGNYNKYGASFNNAYDSWCGYFVSWCANQAGVPTSILKRTGWASPTSFGIPSYSGKNYTPQPGDLYFQVNSSGGITHVGLVVAVDAARGIAITVEGNTWDSTNRPGVYRKERKIADHIFGVPDYGDGGANPHDHTYGSVSYESAHPHKAYKSCTVCGTKSYTGETKTVSGCQSCCSHSYGSWSSASTTKHQHTCTKCGYKESKNHSWGSDTVIKEATCNEVGKKQQTCSVCSGTRTVDIPKATKHIYGQWEMLDETHHQRLCTLCNAPEKAAHKVGEEWLSDEEKHWHPCTVCQAPMEEEIHTEREYCSVPCEICQYVKPDGHLYQETFTWDKDFHFRKCMFCPAQTDIMPHKIAQELWADRKEHYYPCEGCDYRHNAAAHTLSEAATEEQAQICLECRFEYTPKLPHVHFYAPMEYDTQAHWGKCTCGQVYEREEHILIEGTGLCKVCLNVPATAPVPTLWEQMTQKGISAWEWTAEKTTSAWEWITQNSENAMEWTIQESNSAWEYLTLEENRVYFYMICGGASLVAVGLILTIVLMSVKSLKKKKVPVA